MTMPGPVLTRARFTASAFECAAGDARRQAAQLHSLEAAVVKTYKLLAADGSTYESIKPGTVGGHRRLRIYGRLDCRSAISHLVRGDYARHRVFFADEAAAIAAGFRPCARCLSERYRIWKSGGVPGSPRYPWLIQPKGAGAA